MPEEIIQFWFHEIDPKLWFSKDEKFDELIRSRFSQVHGRAMAGETAPWRTSPEGRLAEIIVLDQFSRNMFRDSPQAFASDGFALNLAQAAVDSGDDMKIPIEKRAFVYLPFMHSENAKAHERAMVLYDQPGLESNFKFEQLHKAIIDRFGRFPHRNAILGRKSTPEEIEFLKQKGSSF
jgi:uncharacterized protein (DUF924 family)